MKAKQLKENGINHLQSYFDNSDDKEAVKTKFNNISGKTARGDVENTLFQQRTSRSNRVLIKFQDVLDYNLTYEQLNTFEGGVAVEFLNNEYLDNYTKPEKEQPEIFKRLKNKRGSDDNVSAIVVIRGVGLSESQTQQKALDDFRTYLQEKEDKYEDAILIKRRKNIKYSGKGNSCWEGYLYYNIKGGDQESKDSHEQYGVSAKKVQLFNPSEEYAGTDVSSDITLVLLYFAFHSVPTEKRNDEWYMLVDMYKPYLAGRVYDTGNLVDYVSKHISMNIEKDVLYDPIQHEKIYIEDFALKNRNNQDEKVNALDITHQISIKKCGYIFDSTQGVLLTPARPYNLFWSKHLSNMMQQHYSLKEYFDRQREIVEKWKSYNIDALLTKSL